MSEALKWYATRRLKISAKGRGGAQYFKQGDERSVGSWVLLSSEATVFVTEEYAEACTSGFKKIQTTLVHQNMLDGVHIPQYEFSNEVA
jgi:hypothetical protein